jgi:PAS domain S-box-containing protein
MTTKHDEDKLLRSVALQNANSILIARQRAEQRREAYLAEAQRLSHTGSFGWRPSTGEIFWSEETFRIFQYDQTTIPTVELVVQRVHPEDAASAKQTIERALQDGRNFDFEHRLLMPDGSVKYVRIVAHALSDEPGGLEFVGAVMDVTAAKEAEDRIRLIINAVPALIWTARADGRLDFISQRWLDYAGINTETVGSGELGERSVHPDDIDQLRNKWRVAVAEGNPFEAEIRVRRFDGEYRWFLSRACPFRDRAGRILGWYGNDIDIEDRKRAAEALRQSESNLAEAQKLTHTGSWAWRIAGRDALHLSEEWYRIYGFDPENGPPAFEERLERTHPEDRAKWRGAIERAVAEKSDYEVEFRILLPDGSVKHIHTVGHPVLNGSGDLVQFVGSSTDITERKHAEESLRQAQTDLAHVSRATTMGELTASLAHEVNQPIAAALTDANTCVRWLARDQPDLKEAREAASRVVKDAKRAAEIVGRIRLLFRKGASQREVVDVNEVIREIIALLLSEVTRYSILVRPELAEDLPQFMGDRVQLQQVMMNLIMNSIDAMKDMDGKRELIIKSQRAENEELMVSVSDTGVGLPSQQAEQIFNAFFTTKVDGTGMGLRISRSIIESHGGRLWAADNSPRGASFCFTLPTNGETHE